MWENCLLDGPASAAEAFYEEHATGVTGTGAAPAGCSAFPFLVFCEPDFLCSHLLSTLAASSIPRCRSEQLCRGPSACPVHGGCPAASQPLQSWELGAAMLLPWPQCAGGSPPTGAQLRLSVNVCLYSNSNLSTLLCGKNGEAKKLHGAMGFLCLWVVLLMYLGVIRQRSGAGALRRNSILKFFGSFKVGLTVCNRVLLTVCHIIDVLGELRGKAACKFIKELFCEPCDFQWHIKKISLEKQQVF